MSKAPIGLTIMEKLLGILIIIMGALTIYTTYTNLVSAGALPSLFVAAGAGLILIGFLLLIARTD